MVRQGCGLALDWSRGTVTVVVNGVGFPAASSTVPAIV